MVRQSSIAPRPAHGSKARQIQPQSEKTTFWVKNISIVVLLLILGALIAVECALPLGTAVKIGADEDFELSKVPLVLHGHGLYTEVWNDQPPLYAFLLSRLAIHFSYSILFPRLLTVGASLVLIGSFYLLAVRLGGMFVATLASGFLIASPGFLELSSSAMQEVPALSPVLLCLCLLVVGPRIRWAAIETLAGVIFGVALQFKLIGVMYLPLVFLVLWQRGHPAADSIRSTLGGTQPHEATSQACPVYKAPLHLLCIFTAAAAVTFLVVNSLAGAPLAAQVRQAWFSHFAATQSFEYGSPSEHACEWLVLVKNWDVSVPALVGVCLFAYKRAVLPHLPTPLRVFPVAWLALTLIVFSIHKPWWAYYYIHNSLPLCLCAAFGWGFLIERTFLGRPGPTNRKPSCLAASRPPQSRMLIIGLSAFAVCSAVWMTGRVYLQIESIRRAPRLYTALVLKEIARFEPFTAFMFTDQPIYSFHSRIPLPPHLAMMSLKRFWSGDMSNARLIEELESTKPGLMLLANDTRELPFQRLLDTEYRLVYEDSANRLYAHRSIVKKARY